MKYIVYLTTNKINGHIYVGVHSTETPEVFDGYIGDSINIFKSNPELKNPKLHFHRAVKKYGYDAFKRSTIKVFDTVEEALDLEGLIVDEAFVKRKDTYNMTVGGGLPPLANKTIYQYDLDGNLIKEWKSLTEAADTYDTTGNTIGIAANYKRTSMNYLWSFLKVDKLNVSEYNIYNPKIPIYLYDNDKIYLKCYDSMTSCAKDLCVNLSRVQRAARLGHAVDKYYLSLTLSANFIAPKIGKIVGNVHQYNLDGTYVKSYTDLKNFNKVTGFNIYEVNRAIKMNTTYKEFIWIRGEKLESVPPKLTVHKKSRKIGQYTKEGTLVRIFNTLRECKKEFPNVSKVLRGQAKHCHNYLFKYEE